MWPGSRDRGIQTFPEHQSHLWSLWGNRAGDGWSWHPIRMKHLIELEESNKPNTHPEIDYSIHTVESLLNTSSGWVYAKHPELFKGLGSLERRAYRVFREVLSNKFLLVLVSKSSYSRDQTWKTLNACGFLFCWICVGEKKCTTLNSEWSPVWKRRFAAVPFQKLLLVFFKDFPRILLLTCSLE